MNSLIFLLIIVVKDPRCEILNVFLPHLFQAFTWYSFHIQDQMLR